MDRTRRLLALIMISIQAILAIFMLWVQRSSPPWCRLVTLIYALFCILEIIFLSLWFRKKNKKNLQRLREAYRLKRHDTLNSLQILHMMTQLGKTQEAIDFISSLGTSEDTIDNINLLEDLESQAFLLELFFYFHKRHIKATIEAPEDLRIPIGTIWYLRRYGKEVAKDLQASKGRWEIKLVFQKDQVHILSVVGEKNITW